MKTTKNERAAILKLMELAKIWPSSLMLFSRAGRLVVLKRGKKSIRESEVAFVAGIPNDGGDPSDNDSVSW